jgi:hypothetical protein
VIYCIASRTKSLHPYTSSLLPVAARTATDGLLQSNTGLAAKRLRGGRLRVESGGPISDTTDASFRLIKRPFCFNVAQVGLGSFVPDKFYRPRRCSTMPFGRGALIKICAAGRRSNATTKPDFGRNGPWPFAELFELRPRPNKFC